MDDQDKDTISLLEYAAILWRWKYVLLCFVLMSLGVTAYKTLSLPKLYAAETIIIAVGSESGGLGAALTTQLPFMGVLSSSQSPADKIMIFLKSRSLGEVVMNRFDLMRVFNENKWDKATGTWKKGEQTPYTIDTVNALAGMTKISKTKDGALSIIVTWTDPKLAADIANFYVYALTEFLKDKSINTTIQVVDKAVPPERNKDPKLGLKLLIAGFLGVMGGSITVFVLDYVLHVIRKTSQSS